MLGSARDERVPVGRRIGGFVRLLVGGLAIAVATGWTALALLYWWACRDPLASRVWMANR